MKPLYALHKDHSGKILGASSFSDDYSLRSWVGKLDLRDGDAISFGEVTERPEFDEVETVRPAFLESEPLLKADEPISPAPALAGGDQPF